MAVYKILFGTYTNRVSKGIYEAELDTEKKLLFVENEGNPVSYLLGLETGCLVGSSITIEGEIE